MILEIFILISNFYKKHVIISKDFQSCFQINMFSKYNYTCDGKKINNKILFVNFLFGIS